MVFYDAAFEIRELTFVAFDADLVAAAVDDKTLTVHCGGGEKCHPDAFYEPVRGIARVIGNINGTLGSVRSSVVFAVSDYYDAFDEI